MRKIFVLIFMALLALNAFPIDNNVLRTALKDRKHGNEKIEVLRVKKSKIESPAQDFIFVIQDELDDCYKLLKKKEDISAHIDKALETIQDIQKIDSNWPIHTYVSEIEFLQKHNTIETSSFETGKKPKKKEHVYSGDKEPISGKKTKIKTREDKRSQEESISTQETISNQKNEKLSDSICDDRYTASAVQQSSMTEQALEDTNTVNESVSDKQEKSDKSVMFFIVIIIIGIVVIRWIRANMHLFFGGILALSIFLIYGGSTLFWGVAIIDIALWITYYLYTKRCPICKKWGAMEKFGSEEYIGSYTKYRKEKFKSERKNNRTGTILYTDTQEGSIPVEVNKYCVHRKCKNCGYEDFLIVEREA